MAQGQLGATSFPELGTTKTPYEECVRRLYLTNMFHKAGLGLTTMNRLNEILGYPMDDRTVIHIAGTNGKGSVALKIANALHEQQIGLKVGLFVSPHVSSFRERMQVNRELISEEEVVELMSEIYDLCQAHDIPATYFEITTALAFSFYRKRQCDVVVLETGLGGRLDATNVVKNPALSIITSIGLEHTRILGDTVELIAVEKGGIIKRDCPVLVGLNVPHAVLRQCAREKESGPYYLPDEVLGGTSTGKKVNSEPVTDYDKANQQIAKAALVLLGSSHPKLVQASLVSSEEALERVTSVRPPCRFEQLHIKFPPEDDSGNTKTLMVVLDVAHNPQAMEYMVSKLRATYLDATFRFVVGMSSDKDLGKCGSSILSIANDPSTIHLVQAASPRAAKLEDIQKANPGLVECQCNFDDRSVTKQVVAAMGLAKERNEILVVCGSVFLMADARAALGVDEPRDSRYVAEVAGAGFRGFNPLSKDKRK